MKRLAVGVLAHVDSGKTTLSEALLYTGGQLKKLGRVDHGDAFLDTYALERQRGITIFSKQALLHLADTELTLLDTPGHVDFSTEMERTLQVLDYALLVISGSDGVQSHTETLWRLLERYQIPTFIFINKMDLAGAEQSALLSQLRRRFSEGCVAFGPGHIPGPEEEELAMCDEGLLERFVSGLGLPEAAIAAAIDNRRVFPCYFGSALRLEGVEALLDGLNRYTLRTPGQPGFAARVYKIATDEQGARLTYLKLTGGRLRVKDQVRGMSRGVEWTEKADQLRLYSGAKYTTVEEALPGMICAATGLTHTYPGQGLGAEKSAAEPPLLQPVLTYRVELPPGQDAHSALAKLRLLEEEDPQLQVVWSESHQEIQMRLMGEVQLEVLQSLIQQRFQMPVRFGQGNIIYQETIAAPVEGVGHFEPLRHYAEVHLLLEPGERGSGLVFAVSCREEELDKNWQRLILTHLREKAHLGVLIGAPITDMKITLAAGRAHQKHTEGGDFRQATYRAVRQGLKQAKSILLEPWYEFSLELPADCVGRAMSDLQRMKGSFEPPLVEGDMARLLGRAPVARLQGYQLELTGYSRGRGRLYCALGGYLPCHNTEEVVAASGYDADSDLDNPADSVFCAHGAGFLVKWDQVPEYMHLPAVLQQRPPQEESPAQRAARRAAAYCAALEEDKELLRIFERTYGPVHRDPRVALTAPASVPTLSPLLEEYGDEPEYLLVDGYNIIFAWEDLQALAEQSLDEARRRLIDILCNYQAFYGCQLILVFDAYRVKGNPGQVEQVRNIHVVYTKEAETADMYIEKVTHELGRKRRVRVATSDGLIQYIILGQGALRESASTLRAEVQQVEQVIRGYLAGQV